ALGHHQVQQRQCQLRIALVVLDRGCGTGGNRNRVAFSGEKVLKRFPKLAVVIHDQNIVLPCRVVAHGATASERRADSGTRHRGSRMAAVVPSPGVLSSRILPPCSATM